MRNKGKAMLGMVLAIGLLAGCASKNETNTGASAAGASASASAGAAATASASPSPASKDIKNLKISFVPSKDPQQIITTTEPLKALLTE